MSLQMLVRCKRCGKPLTRDNVSILDDELCRDCEKKKMKEIKEMSIYIIEEGKKFKTKVFYCQNCNNGDFIQFKFYRGTHTYTEAPIFYRGITT